MGSGPSLVVKGSFIVCFLFVVIFSRLSASISAADAMANPSPPASVEENNHSSEDNQMEFSGDCEISSTYPSEILQWCSPITEYARQFGLEADLIAAVILQESGGDPLAYSHSGAVGLMQIMPRDGLAASFQCVNGPCFASRPTIAELENPEYNIEYGTRMLASLVERRGSLREALYSYGPVDVGYRYAEIVLNIYDKYKE